jgi:hypothetical protein
MSSGSQHTGCLKSTLLKAAHGTAIDVQRLPGHPGGILTAQIAHAAIHISARSSPLDHPLLDGLLKGFCNIMALGSLGVDRARSDPIAGDARIGHLVGQAVGKLIEGKLADRVDTTRLIGPCVGYLDHPFGNLEFEVVSVLSPIIKLLGR